MGRTNETNLPYALGHSDLELKRLSTQASLIGPITRRFFLEAGIMPGMRVLDVGSGAGDVAILLSHLIDSAGNVVGTDMSARALATARRRAVEAGLSNVSFREGDPSKMHFDEPFDAVVGRYALQFIADPASMLSKLATLLRPRGLIVFHELDWKGERSVPPLSFYDRWCALCAETIRRLGAETSMGPNLYSAFISAGLKPPTMRLECVIGAGREGRDSCISSRTS
jgi:ubiquinone/menaquinone biosynthesis C-methylase UbiE